MSTDSYKIIIAGDILPSEGTVALFERGDSRVLFDDKIRDLFHSACFSIVNLEGPLTDAKEKQVKVGPVLKASMASVKGLKDLGVTCVALANNHFTDYKDEGCRDTINALNEAEILHVGGGSSIHERNVFINFVVGSRKVCVYNVSETFFNVLDDNSGVNIYDDFRVCDDIVKLKRECDYLIVIYHGGAEMFPYPTPMVRKRFHRMADCGADFISAQHTHCIGCQEEYNNSILLYGQGNFFFPRMKSSVAQSGLITTIDFSGDKTSIYHQCVSLSEGKLTPSGENIMEGFRLRSRELADDVCVQRKYENFISNNKDLMSKYYRAYSGTSIFDKLIYKISRLLYYQYVEKKYSDEQLRRIVFSLESDRMREDVTCLWKTLLNKK